MALPFQERGTGSSGAPPTEESLSDSLPRSRRGYDRAATEELLGELASRHAELERECGTLRAHVAQLEADLATHREQEQLVSKALVEASSHATKIREKAREEAELILRKANARLGERAALTERAERERAEVEQELARLRQLAQDTQHGLASFLSQTLAQLRPEAEPATAESHTAGEAEGTLVSALEDALEHDRDQFRPGNDALPPSRRMFAPPRQSNT
jgi:cell division initiation protein